MRILLVGCLVPAIGEAMRRAIVPVCCTAQEPLFRLRNFRRNKFPCQRIESVCSAVAVSQGPAIRPPSTRNFPMTDLPTDETATLIASDKVEGTAVYNPEGEKLGTISNFMVDKE